MKEEITRIMKLVQEGKLTPEDAAELIEAFEGTRSEATVDDSTGTEDSAEQTETGEGEAKAKTSEDPFSKLIGGIEKITKDVSHSINWKDIADQVRTGVNRGAEAVKAAMDDAAKGRGPFSSVFGHQVRRHFELPLDVPAGKVLKIEGISGNVTVEGGHDIGSIEIDATFRAYNEEEAEKAAERYVPILEESDQAVSLRHHDGENLSADVHIRVRSGVAIEAKVTSGDVRIAKTGSSVRLVSTSGDVDIREVDGTVEVNVISGDVRVEDASAAILAIESKSGDIRLARIGGSVNVRTSSGDVMAHNCSARNFAVDAASGDIFVDLSQPVEGTVNLRTVSGDIKLEVPDRSDARVTLSTLRGAVRTTLELADESQEKLTITGRLGEGSGSIDASAVNGDVYLGLRDSSDD